MSRVLMIIAPENFRDEELFHTKGEIEKAGHSVKVASKTTGDVKGMIDAIAKPDLTLDEINVDEYEAIIFVGGSGASVYFNDKQVLDIAKKAHEKGKVLGAICIAPSILANAGILEGVKVTSWPSEQTNLLSKGAHYSTEPVVIDGKIITANGPTSASSFGKNIANLLK